MTLDDLRDEIDRVLCDAAEAGCVRTAQVEQLLLAAREYAAAEVEICARQQPWPWPPRRPEPHQLAQGEHPAQRSAG